MTRYSQQLIDTAKLRFLAGRSFREIAEELLPTSSGGWVTVFRWKQKYGWEEEKQEIERRKQEAVKDDLADMYAKLAHRQLEVAEKGMMAVELALDEFFERDPLSHRIIGIKLNPKDGMPYLRGQTLVMLLDRASDIQRRAVGAADALPREDLERARGNVVEEQRADPAMLKAFGDYLSLLPPNEGTSGPVTTASDSAVSDMQAEPDAGGVPSEA